MVTDEEEGNTAELKARIEALEETVEELETAVQARERAFNLLIAKADIETLTATCPNCGQGELKQRSGITWSKARCPRCSTEWLL